MGIDVSGEIRKAFSLKAVDLRTYAPLTLAYIGDAIYDLVVRTVLVEHGDAHVKELHARASGYVKAAAQKELFSHIREMLTEEELAYYRRGRNAKPLSVAKNATVADYRAATGLEALCGYLYLSGQTERLLWLIREGMEALDGENKEG